eukprot:4274253-Pleurochrysis_carterae.AAC.2
MVRLRGRAVGQSAVASAIEAVWESCLGELPRRLYLQSHAPNTQRDHHSRVMLHKRKFMLRKRKQMLWISAPGAA